MPSTISGLLKVTKVVVNPKANTSVIATWCFFSYVEIFSQTNTKQFCCVLQKLLTDFCWWYMWSSSMNILWPFFVLKIFLAAHIRWLLVSHQHQIVFTVQGEKLGRKYWISRRVPLWSKHKTKMIFWNTYMSQVWGLVPGKEGHPIPKIIPYFVQLFIWEIDCKIYVRCKIILVICMDNHSTVWAKRWSILILKTLSQFLAQRGTLQSLEILQKRGGT